MTTIEENHVNLQKLKETVEKKYPYQETDKIGNNYLMSENLEQLYRREGFIDGVKWLCEQGESITADVVEYNGGNMLSYDGEFSKIVQKLNVGDKVIIQLRKI